MRQEPKLFSSGNAAPPPQDGFHVEPRRPAAPPPPERDDERRGRGFPWRLVLGLVALVVIGVVVWQGAGLLGGSPGGSQGDAVPVFQASVDPFKHRPDDPGGMDVPNQDVTVYDTLGAAEGGEGLEQLLPEPEEPIAIEPEAAETVGGDDGVIDVGAVPEADVQQADENAEPIFTADQVSDLVDQALTEAAGDIPVPAEKPTAPPAPESTVATVSDTGAAEAASDSGGGLSFSDVAASLGGDSSAPAAAETAPAAQQEETTTAAVPAAAPAGGGGYWVQIAAYSTREVAAEAWQRLARDQADLLSTATPRVMETSVAGTTLHRLQVGVYASHGEAEQLCNALKQRQIDCMIVGP